MSGDRESRVLDGERPYYRLGDGPRDLAVFAGLSDAFHPEGTSSLSALLLERYYYRAFTDAYTLHVVGRPRGLPEGHATREMADGYAEVLEGLAPVDVYGVSLGGLVAQHLAADRPDLVDRLVLGVSGCRVGAAGRRTLRRWHAWAEDGRWFDVYLDAVPVTYTGYRRWLYPPLLRTVGRAAMSRPAAVSDVAVSCRACLEHDAADRLEGIEAPTLVIGGTEDHFFPAEVLRETADRIGDARLELFEGEGHGVYEERKRAFDATVKTFLRSPSGDRR